MPADRLTPGCVALLGQVGKVDEVSPLLGSSRSEIVLAAGQALAETMAGYTPLLNAARRDPALFGSAILAIQRFDPSPDGFTTAESLPSPSPDRRRDALEKLAWSLPAPTLLIIAARQSDLTLRESYARRAEEGEFLASPADAQSKADLVVLLARTRLLLRNPAGALAALDAAGRANLACEGCVLPRVTALVWLNRLDEASALTKAGNLPARPWLDALAWAIESDHARAIRERIRELYSVTLTKQEQEELSALDARMGAPQGAAPNGAAMPQGVPSSSPPAVQPGPGTAPPGPGAHAGMGSAAATLGRASGASLSR